MEKSMKSKENAEKIISALISKIGNTVDKKGKDKAFKEESWAIGAVWMANFLIDNYSVDADPNKIDSLIKARILLDSNIIEELEELIKTSHLDAGYNSVFVPSANTEKDENHICYKCNYMKKDRPDGLMMKSGHIWCRKTSREVLRKYWCKMGKWGYS
jgi:hypothetical protein